MKKLFEYLVAYTIGLGESKGNQQDESIKVRAFLLVWLTTTFIMWFYVWFSFFVYDFDIVGELGIIYSLIHTLTPLFYRHSKSLVLAGLAISLSALAFQVTFAIFNGGIHSPSAIWFTAHPVIMSFFGSKRLIIFSIALNTLVVLALTFMGNYGFFPADALPLSYTEWMTITSLILMDIVIASYTIVFITTTAQSASKLAQRNEIIENLMRIISHDVNNTITASNLTADILLRKIQKEGPDAISKEYLAAKLSVITSANKQIQDTCDSTLKWMLANEKAIRLDNHSIPLRHIAQYIEERFHDLARHKSLQLLYDFPDEEIMLVADKSVLESQVINNLLSNAIKFSENGSQIVVQGKREGKSVIISIADQGIGIPKEIQKQIFDPSQRVTRKGTAGEIGTGFGLTIVKSMLECMDGDLTITSPCGESAQGHKGTTVAISLPSA